jgi:hypothetical protein
MGLLTTECLHEETAIDRRALWTTDEFDSLVGGLLREPPPEEADPLLGSEPPELLPELLNVRQPMGRDPDRWFELELGLLRALLTHET